jgi:hypothetical protein
VLKHKPRKKNIVANALSIIALIFFTNMVEKLKSNVVR